MARIELVVTELQTSTNVLNGIAFSGTAGIADGHFFPLTGKEIILVKKTSALGIMTLVAAGDVNYDPIEDRLVTVETTDVPLLVGSIDAPTFRQSDGTCHIDYAAGVESEFSVMVIRI